MKTLMLAAWLFGGTSDAVSTHYALTHGATEAVLSNRPVVTDIMVGTETAGGAFLLIRLHRSHPKTAVAFGILAGAGRSYIAYRNVRAVSHP
jgi:hypothetical protein